MNNKLIVILISLIAFMCLFIWTLFSLRKQVVRDWETLDELKTKSNEVSTKEEIEEFHKEFVEKANKIYNHQIQKELSRIDGFLRGLYKQYKN